MIGYALRRLVLIPLTFFLTFVLAFALARAAPVREDVLPLPRGEQCDRTGSFVPQLLESFAHWCRLDVDPCTGRDVDGAPVVERVLAAMPVTLSLAGTALAASVILGVMLGAMLAVGPMRRRRTPGTVLAVLESVPGFVVAPLLLWLLALSWRTTPAVLSDGVPTAPAVLALSLSHLAANARLVRDGLRAPGSVAYRVAALARGHSRTGARLAALRLAVLPVFANLGATSSAVVMSAVAIEIVFAAPGLGGLLIDAGRAADANGLLGAALAYAVVLLVSSALFDVAYAAVDPRVRSQT